MVPHGNNQAAAESKFIPQAATTARAREINPAVPLAASIDGEFASSKPMLIQRSVPRGSAAPNATEAAATRLQVARTSCVSIFAISKTVAIGIKTVHTPIANPPPRHQRVRPAMGDRANVTDAANMVVIHRAP